MSIQKLYLNESEASYRYGYSRQWFQRERWKGTGPKFLKISGKVLYPLEDTDNWFSASSLKQSTSETTGGKDA
ncbi:MAG: DNA-binding protein [Rickettsiella sp.]|nr:DNA-binding protein [Rickettsiella sp.]